MCESVKSFMGTGRRQNQSKRAVMPADKDGVNMPTVLLSALITEFLFRQSSQLYLHVCLKAFVA